MQPHPTSFELQDWLDIIVFVNYGLFLFFFFSFSGCDFDEKPRVLAVDDSLVDRKCLERLLINSACNVTTAENGEMALEVSGLADGNQPRNRDFKVNIIITDYCMPGMTGYELLKKIKDIPVVIVSSENVPIRRQQCLEEGAQEFLLKPIRLSDVKKLRCNIKTSNCMERRKFSRADTS